MHNLRGSSSISCNQIPQYHATPSWFWTIDDKPG
ncbi:hypothetical protein T12_14405 [Trichinella patagoniensis]|uniref:Uncharacterized protein n=1 Tax=Trichinella patagoniensis TaxID=990121 RepID=A0A0V0YCT9_9BILA|nr:hypothetical protein T12_14405 [Trichinella patagoniensis]